MKIGDGRGKHLALPLILHLHSKLSGQQGHLLQGRVVQGEPPSLAEKLWNVKALPSALGFAASLTVGSPPKLAHCLLSEMRELGVKGSGLFVFL